MYEDADEVDSICSIQHEIQPILPKGDNKRRSFTEFPNEVEIRFAPSPGSGRQGINRRYIVPVDTHLNERSRFSETHNISDSMSHIEAKSKGTKKSTMTIQSSASSRKCQFFRQILCIDCF